MIYIPRQQENEEYIMGQAPAIRRRFDEYILSLITCAMRRPPVVAREKPNFDEVEEANNE